MLIVYFELHNSYLDKKLFILYIHVGKGLREIMQQMEVRNATQTYEIVQAGKTKSPRAPLN